MFLSSLGVDSTDEKSNGVEFLSFQTMLISNFATKISSKRWFLNQLRSFSLSCCLETLEYYENSSQNQCGNSSFNNTDLQHRMRELAKSGFVDESLNTLSLIRRIEGKTSTVDYRSLLYYYLKSGHVTVSA